MKTADKKTQIIMTAMELFAKKGAFSTSMQEIAEQCGMSKGSLYLTFKSKEELEESVWMYCFRMIRDPILAVEHEEGLAPRDKLQSQVEILLTHMFELREFLERMIRDMAGSGRTGPADWLCGIVAPLIRGFGQKLESIYGAEIAPYAGDLFLIAQGMLEPYIRILFHPRSTIPVSRPAAHLVRMLDIAAAGLLASRPEPLISADDLALLMAGDKSGDTDSHPLQLIRLIKEKTDELAGLSGEQRSDILDSLDVLEQELSGGKPRRVILKGMLSHLRVRPELQELAGELDIQMAAYTEKLNGFLN